jgi:hypothetical protein
MTRAVYYRLIIIRASGRIVMLEYLCVPKQLHLLLSYWKFVRLPRNEDLCLCSVLETIIISSCVFTAVRTKYLKFMTASWTTMGCILAIGRSPHDRWSLIRPGDLLRLILKMFTRTIISCNMSNTEEYCITWPTSIRSNYKNKVLLMLNRKIKILKDILKLDYGVHQPSNADRISR